MRIKKETTPVQVFIEAYACSEFGSGPRYALLKVDKGFLATLRRLTAACLKYGLSEVRCYGAPDTCGPGTIETELRLTCGELVVTPTRFWFTDSPKHADYSIESRSQDVEEFIREVQKLGPADRLVLGEDDELEELVAEDEESDEVAASSELKG